MKRLFVILPLVLLLISPYAAAQVFAQCGTPVPTWTPTPTYQSIVLGTQSAHLIAYYPLTETSGTAADDLSNVSGDGTYSGATLNAVTFLNGDPAPAFDGVNDSVNIYTPIVSTFDVHEGSILIWGKVNGSGNWSDGSRDTLVSIGVGPTNKVEFFKATTSNTFTINYVANGVTKGASVSTSTTNWFAAVLTWSLSGDQVQIFWDGSQVGSTLTGLGTWSGAIISSRAIIGVTTTSNNEPWYGDIAHVAIWNTPLSASEVTALYNVPAPGSPTPTVQPTCTSTPTSTPTDTPALTWTPTPSITPTADLMTFWTAVPPETTGTPEPGQPFGFAYVASAGQIGIVVMLAAILFVLVATALIVLLRRRRS